MRRRRERSGTTAQRTPVVTPTRSTAGTARPSAGGSHPRSCRSGSGAGGPVPRRLKETRVASRPARTRLHFPERGSHPACGWLRRSPSHHHSDSALRSGASSRIAKSRPSRRPVISKTRCGSPLSPESTRVSAARPKLSPEHDQNLDPSRIDEATVLEAEDDLARRAAHQGAHLIAELFRVRDIDFRSQITVPSWYVIEPSVTPGGVLVVMNSAGIPTPRRSRPSVRPVPWPCPGWRRCRSRPAARWR